MVLVCVALLILAAFIASIDAVDAVPYVPPRIFHTIQLAIAVVAGLGALGLVYKEIRLKRQLKHARRTVSELRSLSDVRETFIGMAAHRMRTPISGIKWAMSALAQNAQLDEQARHYVEKSKEEAEKADSLLEKLLRAQHVDLDDFQLSEKEDNCDLAKLIDEVLEEVQHLADENNTDVQFDDSLNVTIQCDKYLLQSALTNIIDNAIRYSPDGNVRIMLQPASDNSVKIVVADDGIGMSPTEQQHLFERFYRGEGAQQIAPHETGLGMYLSNQVVGLHGGTIEVSSVKGEGTTITVTIPQE